MPMALTLTKLWGPTLKPFRTGYTLRRGGPSCIISVTCALSSSEREFGGEREREKEGGGEGSRPRVKVAKNCGASAGSR